MPAASKAHPAGVLAKYRGFGKYACGIEGASK
jgi:hypothetical protein